MSAATEGALALIAEARRQLDLVAEEAPPGANPLDSLPGRLDAWKAVFRPQIAEQIGTTALKALDDVSAPRPFVRSPSLPGTRRVSQAELAARAAMRRIAGYRTALSTIKASIERFEDGYLVGVGRITPSGGLHPIIDNASSALFRDGHYADAVFGACKALIAHVKQRSGLPDDGKTLMDKAFSVNNPVLRFNELHDDSDRDEQQGLMLLFQGAVLAIRNPRGHRLSTDSPERGREYLDFLSLLAKLVGEAKKR